MLCAIALDRYDELFKCPCGCGAEMDKAHDPKTAGRWQPHVVSCWARQGLEEFQAEHKEQIKPHHMVWVTLAEPGEAITDPFAQTEESVAADVAAMQERVRLASGGAS